MFRCDRLFGQNKFLCYNWTFIVFLLFDNLEFVIYFIGIINFWNFLKIGLTSHITGNDWTFRRD